MGKTFCKAIALVVLCAAAVLAGALPAVGDIDVDFRTAAWSGANYQNSFAVDDVTATARPDNATLWQDGVDGLGVRGGSNDDEIERREKLKITFATAVIISAFGITDLFAEPDGGGADGGEYGIAKFYLGGAEVATVDFYGNDSDQENGEQWITGLSYTADKVKFYVGNDNSDNEFSVGGFNVSGVPDTENVPEPGTLSLMAIGLGAVALAYRRRKASNN